MTTPRRADGTGDVTLPAGAEEVAGTVPDGWRRLERRSHAVAAAYSLAVATPVAVAIVRGMTGAGVAVELIVAACAGAALLILAGAVVYDVLRWRATEYRVTGERVELRSGVVQRRHRSVPRERVRTADVTADPVRRVLGLAVLKIGTGEHAGEGASELSLDPISRREAERLRALLLHAPDRAPGAARPDAARSPGTAYSADGASSPAGPGTVPIASLAWGWIRLAPLTVWSFVGGGALLGVAYKALDVVGVDLFQDVLDPDRFEGVWRGLAAWPPWLLITLGVLANLLVGVAGALLMFVESWWRYRLDREPGGTLLLRRGLLTKRSVTLAESRLRGVQIAEPLLLRLGGGARVTAVATGLREAGAGESESADALTPPVPLAEAHRIAREISPPGVPGPGALPGEGGLRGHPVAARRRRARWAWPVAGAAGAVVLGVHASGAFGLDRLLSAGTARWAAAGVAVAVLLAGWGLAAVAYRSLGHGLTSRHLLARSGAVVRRTTALDRTGIIGWKIEQSVFQRRAGLMTVRATTAAGRGVYSVLDAAPADALALADRAVPGLLGPLLPEQATDEPGGYGAGTSRISCEPHGHQTRPGRNAPPASSRWSST